MSNLVLNKVEIAILKGAVRRMDSDPGFNDLLNTLNGLLDEKSGRMYVSATTLKEIQRYGLESEKRTWRAVMRGVFDRSLGQELGRNRDPSGQLTENDARENREEGESPDSVA